MSTRPKPRPKPRPRPRAVAALPPSSSPVLSSSTSLPPTKVVINYDPDEEEDSLFVRNATRTAKTWRKLDEMDKAQEKEYKQHAKRDSSDLDEDDTSSPGPKRRKPRPKQQTPDWTKMSSAAILISSDDDDDDVILQNIENAGSSSKHSPQDADKSMRQRSRSRSRSITPPPPIPADHMALMKERIRQFVPEPRAPSPTQWVDESTDTIVLDPELANVVRQFHSEIQRQQSLSGNDIRSVTPLLEGGGPETVILKVTWIQHPLEDSGKRQTWAFKVKRHDPFKQIYEEVTKSISIPNDELVITLDGKRVFPSASPHGLGIWAEAELEACKSSTLAYKRSLRHRSPSFLEQDPLSQDPDILSQGTQPPPGAQSTDDDVDKFRIIVRSQITADVSLTVRPTTKCGAIVKAFLKATNLTDQYSTAPSKGRRGRGKEVPKVPRLQVDGDNMDPESEIGDAGLEDGDQVEVVGL